MQIGKKVNAILYSSKLLAILWSIGAFILFSRSYSTSFSAFDWLRLGFFAIVGWNIWGARPAKMINKTPTSLIVTSLHILTPFAFSSGEGLAVAPVISGILGVVSLAISAFALLDLGSSFGIVPANRGVVSDGMYRYVRHPAYLGYLLTGLAWAIHVHTPYNYLVFLCFIGLTCLRISLEEATLDRDSAYIKYKGHNKFRLLYGIY